MSAAIPDTTTVRRRTTTTPLRGTGSKSLSGCAVGEGVACTITPDRADYGQVLEYGFDYEFNSATGATGDYTVWVYDVANSALIQPAPYQIGGATAGMPQRFKCTFQVPSNATTLRIAIHNAVSTSAGIEWDNEYCGPQPKAQGTPVTDWVSYTPTGNWTANVTYKGRWRRVGDSMEVEATVTCSGATTSANLSFAIPTGYTIDTAKLSDGGANLSETLGYGFVNDTGTRRYPFTLGYLSNTSVYAICAETTGSTNGLVTNLNPITFGNTDTVSVGFKVPISGWSSNVTMSDSADTRVVAARYYASASSGNIAIAAGGNEILDFDTKVFDTHSCVTTGTSWKYTAKVPGVYNVAACVMLNSVADAKIATMYLYKNNVLHAVLSRIHTGVADALSPSGSSLVEMVAGDYIHIQLSNGDASSRNIETTAYFSSVSVERLSGPSQIAASESISVSAYNTAGTSFTGGAGFTDIPFATEIKDSHGVFATPTFTAPISGDYLVNIGLYTNAANLSTAQTTTLAVSHSGTAHVLDLKYGTGVSQSHYLRGSKVIRMLAGETLKAQLDTDLTFTLAAAAHRNYITITRVGNY
jgi:hypothetical protein